MDFDWPHAIASGVVIAAIVYGLEHFAALSQRPRMQRVLVIAVTVFVTLLLMNMIWPAGDAASGAAGG